ncbi:hypothetical protein, partial [Acinetobacter baumannii]|uniref:hypothetical protein n=1 Tax=Acinetobacter baumannii TaxID=470 RepID=UPI001BB466CD
LDRREPISPSLYAGNKDNYTGNPLNGKSILAEFGSRKGHEMTTALEVGNSSDCGRNCCSFGRKH